MRIYRFLLLLLSLSSFGLQAVTLGDLPNVGDLSLNARILGTLDQGRSAGDFDLSWRETQRDVTAGGDSVIAGYFYASTNQVSWGSSSNPEVYVKIWFAQSGVLNLNFFHVGLFDVRISSNFEGRSPDIFGGRSDDSSRISVEQSAWRYVRHDYCWGTGCYDNTPPTNTPASCNGLSNDDYNFCQTERLLGNWEMNYSIISSFTDTLKFAGGLESQRDGAYNTVGVNQYDQIAVGGYSTINQRFLVQVRGDNYSDVYLFDMVNDNYIEGCHYLVDNASPDNLEDCNPLTGSRLSVRRAATQTVPSESLEIRTRRKLAEQQFVHK